MYKVYIVYIKREIYVAQLEVNHTHHIHHSEACGRDGKQDTIALIYVYNTNVGIHKNRSLFEINYTHHIYYCEV